MKLEFHIWNIHASWKPLEATTLGDAAKEIEAMGCVGEEAKVRNAETGEVYKRRSLPHGISFGPLESQ